MPSRYRHWTTSSCRRRSVPFRRNWRLEKIGETCPSKSWLKSWRQICVFWGSENTFSPNASTRKPTVTSCPPTSRSELSLTMVASKVARRDSPKNNARAALPNNSWPMIKHKASRSANTRARMTDFVGWDSRKSRSTTTKATKWNKLVKQMVSKTKLSKRRSEVLN